MNKNESKYFNTAILMDEALIILISKKDYNFITVKEICAKAGVNRSTFYLHYDNIDDLLAECIENKNKEFIKMFDKKTSDKGDLVLVRDEYLLPYLTYIKENKTLFILAYTHIHEFKSKDKYRNLAKYVIYPILDRFGLDERKKRYYSSFYVNGISAVVREWVETGCQEEIEYISKLIQEIVRADI